MTLITDMIRMQRRQQRQLIDIDAREVVPVVARYSTNAGQSIPNSTLTIINFEDVTFDPRGTVTVGASWAFTCPVAGYYLVTARIALDQTPGDFIDGDKLFLDIYVSGAQWSRIHANDNWGNTNTTEHDSQGFDIVHLDKGDTLNVRAHQDTGSAHTLTATAAENYISIARITP